MKTPAVTDSASAAELETPHSLNEAMETGFLPDDPHYRLTGEFKPENAEASAAFTKPKETPSEKVDASAASESDTAAASEAASAAEEEETEKGTKGKGPAHSKSAETSETRWQKRERELKDARAEITRLKAQPLARSETSQASQPAAEAKAQAAPKPKIDDVDAKTGKAKYANFAEYEDAKDSWLSDEAVRKFQETTAKTTRESEQQRSEREVGQKLAKAFEPVRAKYADFDQVALNPELVIPKGSVVDGFLIDSDHAGEVAYHLGKNPEILQGFYGNHDPKTGKFSNLISPQRQFRKLMEIEATLSGSGSSAAAISDKTSSAKPVTQASRPPHQVSGKGTVAKDAVEQALDDGDFETYQRTQNAKELARLKRK